jgi:hypothetical protein
MKPKADNGAGLRLSLAEMVSAFRWSAGTGCKHDLGERCFASLDEAKRGWEFARRAVWAEAYRFTVPQTATLFDGLTTTGLEFVRWHWNHVGPFDLNGALDALSADRRNLRKFLKQPVSNAIADYLAMFANDCDRVEVEARKLADWPDQLWRPNPSSLNTGQRYGQAPSPRPAATLDGHPEAAS